MTPARFFVSQGPRTSSYPTPASSSASCTLQQGPNFHGVAQRCSVTAMPSGLLSVGRGGGLGPFSEPTEMRVLELVAVLEPVADQTVEADRGEPHQTERDD